MKGGMRKIAMKVPLIAPIIAPKTKPATMGMTTGRSIAHVPNTALGFGKPFTSSVCAKLMAIMAVAATKGPEERSIPAVMITCVTPKAIIPMMATCKIMIFNRASLKILSNRSFVSNKKL